MTEEAAQEAAPAPLPNEPTGTLLDGAAASEDPAASPVPEQATQPFSEQLPEGMRTNPTLSRFKSLEDLANSYVEVRGKMGTAVNIPTAESSPEEVAEFYTKLGRPADSASYTLPDATDQPIAPGTQEWYSAAAHKYGLNQAQAAGLFGDFLDFNNVNVQESLNKQTYEVQQAKEALMKETGRDYNAKIAAAENTFAQTFSPELQEKIKAAGLNNDIDFIRHLMATGESLSEDTIKGTTGTPGTGMSVDGLRGKAQALMNEPDYYSPTPAGATKRSEVEQIYIEIDALEKMK